MLTHVFISGLRVYVDHIPTAYTTQVQVFVGVGSLHEKNNEAGIAHILEHANHLRTEALPDKQAGRDFQDNNQFTTNANTYYTRTNFYARGPHIAPMMEYLGQVIARPRLPADKVKSELGIVAREAKTYLDNTDYVIEYHKDKLMFGDPYGRPVVGYSDKLQYEVEEIQRFYKRHYRLDNMAVVASGKATLEEVVPLVEKYLEKTPLKDHTEKALTVPKPVYGKAGEYGLAIPQSPNAKIAINTILPKGLANKVAHSGGVYGVAARIIWEKIFKTVRDDLRLAYNGGYYISRYNHPNAWFAGTYITCDPKKVMVAKNALATAMQKNKTDISDKEISKAIKAVGGQLLSSLDSIESRADMMFKKLESGLEPMSIHDIAQEYMDLNIDKVKVALNELLDTYESGSRYTLIASNEAAIKNIKRVKFDF